MKKMPVTTAVVLTLTILLLAPLEANAGRGGGMRVGGHGFGHHVVFHRNFFARQHFRFSVAMVAMVRGLRCAIYVWRRLFNGLPAAPDSRDTAGQMPA